MPDEQDNMNGDNGVGDDSGDDFEDDLLDEDEAADIPDAPPTRTPGKKRGRKKKGKGASFQENEGKAAPRPFVESQLSQSLAKTDMGELMNRYDWDCGDFTASLRRVQPQTWDGKNVQGFIATFSERLNEDIIRDKFGGGVYDIVIRGPHPRAGGNTAYLGGLRIKVSGDPKIPRDDKHAGAGGNGDFANETALFLARPQSKPPSLSQIQAARDKGQPAPVGMGGMGFMGHYDSKSDDRRDKMVEMSFAAMQQQAAEASREAQRLQSRLIDEATKEKKGGGVDTEVLRLMRESSEASSRAMKETFEKTMEMQREAQDRVERDRERLENAFRQPGGIPPEMINTMVESHRAEMQAQATQAQTALTEERRRHESEMTRLREYYESKASSDRERLESELRMLREQAGRDVKNLQERLEEVQNRERESRDRDVKQARDEMQRQIETERDRAARDREAMTAQHRLEIEHLKGFHDMNMRQIQGQNESSTTIVKTTMEQRIASLESELDRTRADLAAAQEKVQAHGDLATQASNLKGIMTNLQSVFVHPKAEMSSMPMIAPEPQEEEPQGWLGTLIKFGDSKVGQTVLGTLATAFQQQLMPTAALPGYPGQAGMYGGYPSGPTVPQQYPPYQPQVRNPYVAEEEEEEGYEEVEGTEIPLEEDEAEQEPVINTRVGMDGVLRADVPPGRPSYLGVEEVEPPKGQPGAVIRESAPVSGASRPQANRQPTHGPAMPSPEELAQQMPPAMKQQVLEVINGIEDSMTKGMPPQELAVIVMKITPDPAQLQDLVDTGSEGLVIQALAVKPETMLATRQGRKYIRALVDAVAGQLRQHTS